MRAKEAYVFRKNIKQGLAWGERALDALPQDREVVLLVAGLLLQEGRVRRARQVIMHAHILSGNFGDWLEKTRWLIP